VAWACVYSLPEALDVVRLSPGMKVLVLSPVVLTERAAELPAEALRTLTAGEVRVDVVDRESARRLAQQVARSAPGRRVRIHVQVDTGLTRAGVAREEALGLIEAIMAAPGLMLEGVFSHLSHGDVPGHETVARQVERLREVAEPVQRRLPGLMVHLQNSGGAWHVAGSAGLGLDMVRVGIALYGLQPSLEDVIPELKPIARLVAPVLAIHERPAGVGVGYGHTFTTKRASRLAIVPVGYADGYPRCLSNKGVVQIGGRTAPVVGRVSMDQVIIDVTDVPAHVGDEVTVFAWDPAAPNCIDGVAVACGTIGYEIATGLGHRLTRRIVD